jgi:hypothetical protein
MTRTISFCILIITVGVILAAVISEPSFLSDNNKFLKDFVNHELLSILGVVLAITLASAANLHLEFNKIEEKFKATGLSKSRGNIKNGAYALIIMFFASVCIVVLKPIIADGERSQAVFNGFALLIVEWYILIMTDMLETTFAIPAHIAED